MYQVLYVDDDEAAGFVMSNFQCWKDSDFHLAGIVRNAAAALKKLKHETIDLLITNIRLPVTDGFDLIREIRKRKIDVPVLLCSVCTNFKYVREGMRLGALDFLPKPFNDKDMAEELEYIRPILHKDKKILSGISNTKIEQFYEGMICNCPDIAKITTEILNLSEVSQSPDRITAVCDEIWEQVLKNHNKLDYFAVFHPVIRPESYQQDTFAALTALQKIIQQYYLFHNDKNIMKISSLLMEAVVSQNGVSFVADQIGFCEDYIRAIFKNGTGISLGNYETMLKMEYGARQLEHTDEKIYLISRNCGFKTTDYFSSLFKKYFGMTPIEYRKFHSKIPKIPVEPNENK